MGKSYTTKLLSVMNSNIRIRYDFGLDWIDCLVLVFSPLMSIINRRTWIIWQIIAKHFALNL